MAARPPSFSQPMDLNPIAAGLRPVSIRSLKAAPFAFDRHGRHAPTCTTGRARPKCIFFLSIIAVGGERAGIPIAGLGALDHFAVDGLGGCRRSRLAYRPACQRGLPPCPRGPGDHRSSPEAAARPGFGRSEAGSPRLRKLQPVVSKHASCRRVADRPGDGSFYPVSLCFLPHRSRDISFTPAALKARKLVRA
jgi:hypothetical protein